MTDCTIVQHSSRRAELEPPAISSKTFECQYIVNCDKLRNSLCILNVRYLQKQTGRPTDGPTDMERKTVFLNPLH